MNDANLRQLKLIVEKAVRPVRVGMSRKVKMREELLNHLIGTFEQELDTCGDEERAFLQTERRFGAPVEITRQLQESVPKIHRLGFMDGRLFRGRPGESFVHLAARYSVWACIWQFVILGLLAWDRGQRQPGTTFYLIVLFTVCISGTMFAVMLLMEAVQKALSGRSFVRLALLIPLIGLVSYVPLVAFDYGADPILPGEGHVLRAAWDASLFFLFPTWMLILVAILAWVKGTNDAEGRRADEWEALPID